MRMERKAPDHPPILSRKKPQNSPGRMTGCSVTFRPALLPAFREMSFVTLLEPNGKTNRPGVPHRAPHGHEKSMTELSRTRLRKQRTSTPSVGAASECLRLVAGRMRPAIRVLVLIVGSLTCLPGCSVWHLAHRTMYSELSQYPPVTDGKLSNRQYKRWAKDEWQRVAHSAGGVAPVFGLRQRLHPGVRRPSLCRREGSHPGNASSQVLANRLPQ